MKASINITESEDGYINGSINGNEKSLLEMITNLMKENKHFRNMIITASYAFTIESFLEND